MELYWMYSEKFPEHETFWISMADDERQNTDWVRSTIKLKIVFGPARQLKK
jgi:hypothetical protein